MLRQVLGVKATGSAPMAARSDRLTASDLCPSCRGSVSAKKWVPETSISVEMAICVPGTGVNNAQSSPIPSEAFLTGFVKYLAIRSNSESMIVALQKGLSDFLHNDAIDVALKQDNGKLLNLSFTDSQQAGKQSGHPVHRDRRCR